MASPQLKGRGLLTMTRIIDELVCKECGCTEFLEGPHGGAAVNVKCKKCGYWMNITRLPDGRYWVMDEDKED